MRLLAYATDTSGKSKQIKMVMFLNKNSFSFKHETKEKHLGYVV